MLNRTETTEQPFGIEQTFTYDKADNRTKVEDNKGGVTTSAFDDLNRLIGRELEVSSTNVMKAVWDYDAVGDLEDLTRFDWQSSAWTLNSTRAYVFDDLGRTKSIEHFDDGSNTEGEYTYTYDLADRLTQQVIVHGGGTQTLDYGYDDTNQLTDDDGVTIDYDANGNRDGTGYTVGGGNRVTDDGTWDYVYDDMGQVIEKNKSGEYWIYEYDHRGQMTKASKSATYLGTVTNEVEYTYDAFGNRLTREVTVGTTSLEKYVVDGWDTAKPPAMGTENSDVVMELDGSDDV